MRSGSSATPERDEFRLHFQPIVSLDDGAVVGAEALLRWDRPAHGLLGPASFVPLAEETGLILPIGDWVVGEACRRLHAWQDAVGDGSLTVSVNVAAHQVTAGRLGSVADWAQGYLYARPMEHDALLEFVAR